MDGSTQDCRRTYLFQFKSMSGQRKAGVNREYSNLPPMPLVSERRQLKTNFSFSSLISHTTQKVGWREAAGT